MGQGDRPAPARVPQPPKITRDHPREPMPDPRPTHRFDIVISGASFAGLALARALGAAFGDDVQIALVDRSVRKETTAPDARAFALSAGARRMLETLGIWQEIAATAEPVTGIEITDSSLEAGIRPVLLTYDNHLSEEADAGGAAEPASHIVPASGLETRAPERSRRAQRM